MFLSITRSLLEKDFYLPPLTLSIHGFLNKELLEYINAKTYLTYIEYIKYSGIGVEEIEITFVCENKANINEDYIARKIEESISRLAEHSDSDGKYHENIVVKLETQKYKYSSFRKFKSPTRKSKKSKKTPTMHKSKKTL